METAALDALEIRSLAKENCREYWINSTDDCIEGIGIIQNVLEYLKAHDAKAVSIRLFGREADIAKASLFLEQEGRDIFCPPLLILQDDSPSICIQVHAFSGPCLEDLYWKDEFIGRKFEDSNVSFFMLNVLPDDKLDSEYNQAKNLFEKAHQALKSFGSGFSDTIRTWLYARDILSWYPQLNSARNQFFEQHDIYNQRVPASTGIGAANPQGKAMATQILAAIPKNNKVVIQKANSPLQCPALDYKSSFSRGIKVSTPDSKRLYISGTASIDKTGKTVFIGDTPAQLEKTMQVMSAILNDAGMDWGNVASSLVYFKDRKEFGLFDDYCSKHDIKLPHIKIHADICRDNLLFELELDAIDGTAKSPEK